MSAEQPSEANHAVFESAWYRLILVFFAVYLTAFWFILGPANPAYAVSVVMGTFSLGPAIAVPVARHLPSWAFRVPAGERVFHVIAGVGVFGWLLDASGWNRLVALPMRGFSGTRSGLLTLERGVHASMAAHGACFAIHIILAAIALLAGYRWSGALWMLLPALPIHLYPVLLQRSILLRLQPLLDKAQAPSRRASSPDETISSSSTNSA